MRKPVMTAKEAIADLEDGSTVLAGGFAGSGYPLELFEAVADRGVRGLTLVCLNGGQGEEGAARLVIEGAIDRLVCSFPLGPEDHAVREAVESGRLDMELVPQGTLAEAIRAGGAGLGGVLTKVGLGTRFAHGRGVVPVRGTDYLLEPAIRGQVALIRAHEADPWGNLRYRAAQQNFNPLMAMAADVTIAHVDHIAHNGLEPDTVHTPGLFVDRLVVGDGA